MKKEKLSNGFSLIELLISLIIISLIAASFTPLITKKFKYQNISNLSSVKTNCLKFDKENRCLMCTNEKCTLCTTQFELPEGKYVNPSENCEIKSCPTGCLKCNNKMCISCKSGYGYDGKNCNLCNEGTYSAGINNSCTKCLVGTYQNNKGQNACKTCPDGTYQDETGKADCKNCPSGCVRCNNSAICSACAGGYQLVNGVCKKFTNASCKQIGNICVTRFNIGDSGGLSIEGLVEIRQTSEASYMQNAACNKNSICWRGQTATDECNSANGGYNGCTRTACTRLAAKAVCEYHGWRLPTVAEVSLFASHTKNQGSSGLQICGSAPQESSYALCSADRRCEGSANGYCDTYCVLASNGSYCLIGDNYSRSDRCDGWAASTRCVRDL